MDKKFAIFDMDGTLVDSMPFWRNLTKELLHSRGIKNIDDEVLETIKTMTLIEIATYLTNYYHFDISPEDLKEEMRGLMKVHYQTDVTVKSKVIDYLENLKKSGVKMCIASATPEPLIEICLKRLKLWDYFEFCISCDTVKAGKSKPTIYVEAAKRLCPNVEYKDIAVFEDSYYASTTATNAGFYVIGIYDYCARKTWEPLKALAKEYYNFD